MEESATRLPLVGVSRLDPYRAVAVDRVVDRLAKPVYILRMARAQVHREGPMGEGARNRADKARREIMKIINETTWG